MISEVLLTHRKFHPFYLELFINNVKPRGHGHKLGFNVVTKKNSLKRKGV